MDLSKDTIIGVEKVSAGYKNTVVLQDVSIGCSISERQRYL